MAEHDPGPLRVGKHPATGDAPTGELIKVVVDGEAYYGYAGEPIAMTLLANGIRAGRTTAATGGKRGYFCGVGRCPDCAMMVNGELNVMTCTTPLEPGMIVRTQRGLGSWDGDS